MKTSYKPKVLDLFCGAGGLSLGFKSAGFEIVMAVDNDEDSIKTYNKNIGAEGFRADIHDITKKFLEKHGIAGVDGVIGGPPCQGFSIQRRGSDDDARNELVLQFLRVILETRPKFFLMENVGGLLAKRGEEILRRLRNLTADAGYTLTVKKLNAAHYGVPQNRIRAFLVGMYNTTHGSLQLFPDPVAEYLRHPRTVRDAIYSLAEARFDELPNHRADKLSPINLERIRAIGAGQGRDALPRHLQLRCHTENVGHRHLDTYGRMSWDDPAPTITARFDSFSRGRFGHPLLDRTITLREGARLQTFPDEFEFVGNKVSVARQIGNAVPPMLASILARHLLAVFDEVGEKNVAD